ncbi:MAG: hypothetical protein NVS9B15_05320 [Acidobacteriaceae bacterium]
MASTVSVSPSIRGSSAAPELPRLKQLGELTDLPMIRCEASTQPLRMQGMQGGSA